MKITVMFKAAGIARHTSIDGTYEKKIVEIQNEIASLEEMTLAKIL